MIQPAPAPLESLYKQQINVLFRQTCLKPVNLFETFFTGDDVMEAVGSNADMDGDGTRSLSHNSSPNPAEHEALH